MEKAAYKKHTDHYIGT